MSENSTAATSLGVPVERFRKLRETARNYEKLELCRKLRETKRNYKKLRETRAIGN